MSWRLKKAPFTLLFTKLEHEGWITSEWALSDTNRRVRYYKLTPKGARELSAGEREYHRVNAAIAKALKCV